MKTLRIATRKSPLALWQSEHVADRLRLIEAKIVEVGSEADGARLGMRGGRIFYYEAKKNWWSRAGVPANMAVGEPGGPDSEIFYDFGLPHDITFGKECHPNCDCGRFIEIGNSVFMQFVKQADGSFAELPKKNVDFGGGLARLVGATTNNDDIFMIDVFDAARAVLEARFPPFMKYLKPIVADGDVWLYEITSYPAS